MLPHTKLKLTYITIGTYFLLGGIEYAVILPTIWLYIKEVFDAPPYMLGIILSSFSIADLTSGLVLGRISDVAHQTKLLLILTNVLQVVGSFLYIIGSRPIMLVVSRLVTGFGSGISASLVGDLAKTVPGEERTSTLSVFFALRQAGLVLGPSCNLFLSKFDFNFATYHVNRFTSPGFFMMLLWILHEIMSIFMFWDLSTLCLKEEQNSHEEPGVTNHMITYGNLYDREALDEASWSKNDGEHAAADSVTPPDIDDTLEGSTKIIVIAQEHSLSRSNNINATVLDIVTMPLCEDPTNSINVGYLPIDSEHLISEDGAHASLRSNAFFECQEDSHYQILDRGIPGSNSMNSISMPKVSIANGCGLFNLSLQSNIGCNISCVQSDEEINIDMSGISTMSPIASEQRAEDPISIEFNSGSYNEQDLASNNYHYGTFPSDINCSGRNAKTSSLFKELFKPNIIALLAATFVGFFNQMALEALLTPLTEKYLSWNEMENSYLYCAAGIEIILVFLIIRQISHRIADKWLIAIGMILQLISIGMFIGYIPWIKYDTKIKRIIIFVIIIVINLAGLPMLVLCSNSLFTRLIPSEIQGFSQGIRKLFAGIGTIMGPLWAAGAIDIPFILFGVLIVTSCFALILLLSSFNDLTPHESSDRIYPASNNRSGESTNEATPMIQG